MTPVLNFERLRTEAVLVRGRREAYFRQRRQGFLSFPLFKASQTSVPSSPSSLPLLVSNPQHFLLEETAEGRGWAREWGRRFSWSPSLKHEFGLGPLYSHTNKVVMPPHLSPSNRCALRSKGLQGNAQLFQSKDRKTQDRQDHIYTDSHTQTHTQRWNTKYIVCLPV